MGTHPTFNYGKTAGELTLHQMNEIRDVLSGVVESICGFDEAQSTVSCGAGTELRTRVSGCDLFNVKNPESYKWERSYDIKDDVLEMTVGIPLDEPVDEPLNNLVRQIGKLPGRKMRERRHMAFVLKGQFEQLGHYSPEVREAFQTAFRKSIEDAGLLALADMTEAA